MRIEKAAWFDPALIFGCGQVFHWQRAAYGFKGQSGGRFLALRGEDGGWRLETEDAAYWSDYFDLSRDYSALLAAQGNARLREAMQCNAGLRVLRQPPWEALLAFLLSSNNHIPRITSLVLKLCAEYGESLEQGVFTFPAPSTLIGQEERLRALGCGYRAKYLEGTARMLAEGFPLDSLADMPYARAYKEIMRLPGVGPKVADCVLLFGCGHTGAFPVDVWMERCLPGYGIEGESRQAMSENARRIFGEDAGILQQFMFHAARRG